MSGDAILGAAHYDEAPGRGPGASEHGADSGRASSRFNAYPENPSRMSDLHQQARHRIPNSQRAAVLTKSWTHRAALLIELFEGQVQPVDMEYS